MSFQISSLAKSQFEHLHTLSSEQLASARARRLIATEKPGFPCRVSLADAEIGEEVLLVHYEHQSADTPFRSSHAVYVRPSASEARLRPDEVPDMMRSRTISLRGFDAAGMLVAADLADGMDLEGAIEGIFEEARVAYLHLHFAKPGCFAARVNRISACE